MKKRPNLKIQYCGWNGGDCMIHKANALTAKLAQGAEKFVCKKLIFC